MCFIISYLRYGWASSVSGSYGLKGFLGRCHTGKLLDVLQYFVLDMDGSWVILVHIV